MIVFRSASLIVENLSNHGKSCLPEILFGGISWNRSPDVDDFT